jgi:hypothetical protein
MARSALNRGPSKTWNIRPILNRMIAPPALAQARSVRWRGGERNRHAAMAGLGRLPSWLRPGLDAK